jgi:hypothetical protein
MLAGIPAARLGRSDLATRLLTTTDRLRTLIGAANLPVMNEQWRSELVTTVGHTDPPVETPPATVPIAVRTTPCS